MITFRSDTTYLKHDLTAGLIAPLSKCVFRVICSRYGIVLIAGLLAVARVSAGAPPWEIWNDLHSLAEVRPAQRVLLRSSRCPSGCRFDRHSDGDWRYIRKDGDEGVIFEESGAGAITRIWMTTGSGVSQPLDPSVRIRIYIDGAEQPVLDLPLPDIFNGSTSPFLPPLVGNRQTSSGGNFSYVPITYREGCRVTVEGTDEKLLWYQFNHHRLAEPGNIESFSLEVDLSDWSQLLESTGQDPWSLAGDLAGSAVLENTLVLAPGDVLNLASFTGPDSLTGLRFWLPEATWPDVELSLVFDGNQQVLLPFSDFFATGTGGRDGTRSVLLGTAVDGSLYAYFPMPFFRNAEVSLRSLATAGSAPVMIDYEIRRANREPSTESALFGAQRWIDNETPIGEDIPLLRLEGEGKWVGLFANLGSVNTASRGYLEGDDRVFLDDSNHPEVYGTGTEDIFNGGFYFDMGPFRQALHGAPYHNLLENGEDETAMYRLMLTDGISFASRIAAGLEGGPTGNLSLRARTVAYYYLRPTPGLFQSDVLDLGNPESVAEHDYTLSEPYEIDLLDGLFESEPPMAKQAIGIYRPAGEAHFHLRAVPGARRLRLKRLLDADYAGQEAEIWVDGTLAGRFPPVDRNSHRRWHEIGIDLPPASVGGNGELDFTITALTWPGFQQPDGFAFTAFTYELWSDINWAGYPNCSYPLGLALSSQMVDTVEELNACTTITAGPSFKVLSTGDVTFTVGEGAILNSGFSVDVGGNFSVIIDPDLVKP